MPELPLHEYERKILEAFAGKFNESSHRRGGRKVRIAAWDTILPGVAETAAEKNRFLDAVESLSVRGVVTVTWKKFRKGTDVDAVYLEDDRLLYQLLDKEHPDDLMIRVISSVPEDAIHSGLSSSLLDYCRSRAAGKKDLPFDNPADLQNIVILIDWISEHGNSLPLRALSVKLYHDSKMIERILPGVKYLLKQIGEDDAILEPLNRSFPECWIRGFMTIEFCDGRTWILNDDTAGISLESALKITHIRSAEGKPPSFLSVENKETFYLLDKPDLFCGYIFSHGHLNEAVKNVIQIAYASGNSMSHFGDMDPDGICIFNSVNRLCDMTVSPYCMNAELFKRYSEFGRHLEESQLLRLPEDDLLFADLIGCIRESRKGVEQEIVDLE